jgi:hypothetical protein
MDDEGMSGPNIVAHNTAVLRKRNKHIEPVKARSRALVDDPGIPDAAGEMQFSESERDLDLDAAS